MIKISVVSYNNEATAQNLSAIFDQKGGTLGRSDDNYFVLPDPKRYVSRLQASIRSDGASHKIVNLSQANPILVNGQEINSGQEYDLKVGDEIQIGLYLLRAEWCRDAGEESRTDNCIANDGATQIAAKDLSTGLTSQGSIDPFNPGLSEVAASGFDDLLASTVHQDDLSEPGASVIPDDFDPFSLPSQSLRNTPDPLADISNNAITLASLKNDKADINDFMSSASASYAESLLDTSNLRQNDFSDVDPLALFSSDSVLSPQQSNDVFEGYVISDHVPEVNAHFMMPQAKSVVENKDEVASSGTVSVDEDSVPAVQANPVDNQELMRAFLQGAGTPPNTIFAEVTPEFMEMIGKLLVTSIQGTIELIASRAMVKREVQADMTMIVTKQNNPLKFLPDGQTVLMQMLREKMPGFMEPVEAMQDAYEDLRAHQLGVVAGMRAAMAEVLERFNPELLEKRLKDRSLIDSVLPMNRKAKMWNHYTELFQEISLKAQDDFQALFGKAFVAAYEVEIERFKNGAQDD